MSKQTTLASGQITKSSNDNIEVELIEPADAPGIVVITWPTKPTNLHPQRLAEVVNVAIRLLANASTELARIRGRKYR
jgi:hypothetical protein